MSENPKSSFIMKPTGLFWHDSETEVPDLFLSGPFEILAKTRDTEVAAWGLLLQWKDRDKHEKIWAMPKSLLVGDGVDVRRALLDRGLSIASGTNLSISGSQRPDQRARAVPKTGWHTNRFVFPDSSIGTAEGERCFFHRDPFAHNYRVQGTLDGWKENVAQFAVGNSRLAFSISIALAASLIGPSNVESGGFHLRGASSIGKSTASLVAGSVWGGDGRNGFLTSWRATSNVLEGVAVTHNDALLCLDEISKVSRKRRVGKRVHAGPGSGKSRAARNGRLRKPAEWGLLFLYNGEISLAGKISEDHRIRRSSAGQEVRFIDIPADTGNA